MSGGIFGFMGLLGHRRCAQPAMGVRHHQIWGLRRRSGLRNTQLRVWGPAGLGAECTRRGCGSDGNPVLDYGLCECGKLGESDLPCYALGLDLLMRNHCTPSHLSQPRRILQECEHVPSNDIHTSSGVAVPCKRTSFAPQLKLGSGRLARGKRAHAGMCSLTRVQILVAFVGRAKVDHNGAVLRMHARGHGVWWGKYRGIRGEDVVSMEADHGSALGYKLSECGKFSKGDLPCWALKILPCS
ncbi:hypothetical protein BD779DRAFT_1563553 [Infundibulicybe gibba]|nr:hypothetical protein BD779DRAFT_1563553 [Infundibulicybe gibba]